jgi:soluble lytic murein transglycosylase-like protein
MNLKTASVLMSVLSLSVMPAASVKTTPDNPDNIVNSSFNSNFNKDLFDASRVYGRAGCGDVVLAEETARAAEKTGLPASLIAAEIATESSCNPLAVSRDGGVGLTQIMPKIWASKYNNFRDKNLLRQEDSIEVGAEILAENVRLYGMRDGIRRYNGSGVDAEQYATRVMTLAGVR